MGTQKTEDLSGGQKQIVNLASVLALRPRVLLLDEPTAQLDPNAVKQFLFLLGRVNRELGITVVVATHSPEDVEAYATQRIDRIRRALLRRANRRKRPLRPVGKRVRRHVRMPMRRFAFAMRIFRFDRREPWVLRGIDLNIACGCVHALVGGNGCGKTTLLRCLAGVLKPQRGHIDNALRHSQALLPQDPKALFVCDSVREELMEWSTRCGYGQHEAAAMARRFGLESLEARHPYDLSGGQQQKLALAKLLLANPEVLFLDEPTKGLDPASCADFSRTVRELADEGKTIVFVTHDLDFALVTADFVSMPFDGEIACTEPVQAFLQTTSSIARTLKAAFSAKLRQKAGVHNGGGTRECRRSHSHRGRDRCHFRHACCVGGVRHREFRPDRLAHARRGACEYRHLFASYEASRPPSARHHAHGGVSRPCRNGSHSVRAYSRFQTGECHCDYRRRRIRA